MKPKNLKPPLTWEERRPIIHDGILYVPEYYEKHQEWTFPGWESPEIFGRVAPISVEYCSGNGAWIIEKALSCPEQNWVAVEIQFERVRKIWSKRYNEKIPNLFIVCGEALTFTHYYVPKESFSALYVNFPDPWPKAKHAKNRLLKEPFLSEMARVSHPKAVATIVTDHPEYTIQITAAMAKHPHWNPLFEAPYYVTEWKDYGASYFGDLWQEQGIPIHYMQFEKKK